MVRNGGAYQLLHHNVATLGNTRGHLDEPGASASASVRGHHQS